MNNDLSFKKSDRLLNKKDFSEVFEHRKFFNTQKNFKIFYRIENQSRARFGLIVSKKIAKKAVARNYMKRFLREWFRHNKFSLPNGNYVFFVKKKFEHENFQEINQELDNFKKCMQKKFL